VTGGRALRRLGSGVLTGGGLALCLLPAPSVAQGLESRVRAAEGDVSFGFPIRDGIEVCENRVSWGEGHMRWGRWSDREEPELCSEGLARAVLAVRDGRIRDVDWEPWLGEGAGQGSWTDLGRVGAREATDLFLGVARSGRDRGSRDALAGAAMTDGVEIWPELLAIGRDSSLDEDVREGAVFWVGQAAAEAATEGLEGLARDDQEDQGVRDAAVFALSRRPAGESVPILMDLARTAERAETRKTALFWLAQSDDARVLPFFEDILLGRAGGR